MTSLGYSVTYTGEQSQRSTWATSKQAASRMVRNMKQVQSCSCTYGKSHHHKLNRSYRSYLNRTRLKLRPCYYPKFPDKVLSKWDVLKCSYEVLFLPLFTLQNFLSLQLEHPGRWCTRTELHISSRIRFTSADFHRPQWGFPWTDSSAGHRWYSLTKSHRVCITLRDNGAAPRLKRWQKNCCVKLKPHPWLEVAS